MFVFQRFRMCWFVSVVSKSVAECVSERNEMESSRVELLPGTLYFNNTLFYSTIQPKIDLLDHRHLIPSSGVHENGQARRHKTTCKICRCSLV